MDPQERIQRFAYLLKQAELTTGIALEARLVPANVPYAGRPPVEPVLIPGWQPPAEPIPTTEELQARIAELEAQLKALTPPGQIGQEPYTAAAAHPNGKMMVEPTA